MAKRKGRPDVTTKADIDLENPEFVKLRQLIDYTSQSVFLTGRAGTGKSTFLRYITAHTHKKFVVLAPTGIASVNVGGQTIHSFFKVPLKPLVPDDPEFAPRRLHSRMKYSKSLIKLIKALDLIVIDEISMVRADLVDFMDKILRHYSGNHREPFGGKQMLFVGDVFQLEPVITADTRAVLKDFYPEGMFFFNARAFKETAMVSIELQKVYRQKDGEFLGLLDRLRSGVAAESDLNMLNSRCVSDAEAENADPKRMVMTIATRRDMVDAINEERLGKIKSKAITFVGRITDDFPENSLPANKELILKEGAQVVMLKNDPSRRWVNGSIGRVVSIDTRHKTINVELADTGEVHEVEPVVWSNIRYSYDEESHRVIEEEIGTFTQFPVKLAWALTVHKCQGLTFSNVSIDLGQGAFTSGQTYVALSRCQSLGGLELKSPIRRRDVFVNSALTNFSRTFNDERMINNALVRAKAMEGMREAASLLDQGRFADALEAYVAGRATFDPLGNAAMRRLIRMKLGKVQKISEDLEKAEQQIAQYKQRFSELSDEYVSMGLDCADAGVFDAAAANYKKALSLNPDNSRAAELLAKVEKYLD